MSSYSVISTFGINSTTDSGRAVHERRTTRWRFSIRLFLSCVGLLLGQSQTAQSEDIVRLLPPHAFNIPATAGGEMVELLHAPSIVRLPRPAPKLDQLGNAWYVDVKNLGPDDVTIEEATTTAQTASQFVLLLHPKDIARIRAAGAGYVLVKRY